MCECVSRLLGGAELQKVLRETRVIVNQLMPFTNYSFYVRSYNARSRSRPSAVITQVTAEDGQLQAFQSFLFIPCVNGQVDVFSEK